MQTLNHMAPLEITQILPHPDNPRKELGDLSELTKSIKENGILQEITVIPKYCLDTPKEEQEKPGGRYIEDPTSEYYVLMGHRRLAAYKAGHNFGSLKCKVAYNISRSEQIGIMLEENVQRNELTVPEQIESFQLMLDLGETVETISEKTGFSRSTIYRRISNADVVDEIKEKEDYQLTISDMEELAKVSTEEKKSILKKATSGQDIKYQVEVAIKKHEREEKIQKLIEILEAKGVIEYNEDAKELYPDWWRLERVGSIQIDTPDQEEIEALEGNEYFERPNQWQTAIEIRRPYSETEEISEEEKEEERKRELEKQNMEIIKKCQDGMEGSIRDFLKMLAAGDLKIGKEIDVNHFAIIMRMFPELDFSGEYVAAFLCNKRAWTLADEEQRDCLNGINNIEIGLLACMSYNLESFVTWQGKYNQDAALMYTVTMEQLKNAGFIEPDDSEFHLIGLPEDEAFINIANGTSKLYKQEGE